MNYFGTDGPEPLPAQQPTEEEMNMLKQANE